MYESLYIVLIGSTGEGKSTFGNYILKHDDKRFDESNGPQSCTGSINCCKGKENTEAEKIYVIDTPGISDSKGRDNIFVKEISRELRDNYTKKINCFLILININKPRLSFELKKQLYYYCLMFPLKYFWSHVGVVFTFSYESFSDKKLEMIKENKVNNFMKDFLQTIQTYIKEINNLYSYEIESPKSINTFYTDCGEDSPTFSQKRTNEEINKLIKWASSLSKLDLSDANINVNINYKYYKNINDFIKEEKKVVNSYRYNIIYSYKKQYKTIDFNNNEKIITEPNFYKKVIKYFKKYIGENISKKTEIYDDNYFSDITTINSYYRWDEVDENDNIINYGTKKNLNNKKDVKIVSRNWKTIKEEFKTEFNIVSYDYEIEYVKKWILFIPIIEKYKQPYRLVRNIYYKRETKKDDLGNIKSGDWFVNEYGNTRREYYTSRYRI